MSTSSISLGLHSFSRGQNKKFEDMPRTNAQGRGQFLRPRTKLWPRGQLVHEDLTSLVRTTAFLYTNLLYVRCCVTADCYHVVADVKPVYSIKALRPCNTSTLHRSDYSNLRLVSCETAKNWPAGWLHWSFDSNSLYFYDIQAPVSKVVGEVLFY